VGERELDWRLRALRQLCDILDRLRPYAMSGPEFNLLKERQSDASQLTCQIRRYPTLGFFLYYFDWSSPGGLIRGVPHLWGINFRHSSNFEIKWRGKSKPPVFQRVRSRVATIFRLSRSCCTPVTSTRLGQLVEER